MASNGSRGNVFPKLPTIQSKGSSQWDILIASENERKAKAPRPPLAIEYVRTVRKPQFTFLPQFGQNTVPGDIAVPQFGQKV